MRDIAKRVAYVCGPNPMLEPMRATMRELGLPEERVRFKEFTSARQDPSDEAEAADTSPSNGASASSSDIPEDEAAITFAKSGNVAKQRGDGTVLDTAEDAGIRIPFDCCSGTCGTCKTKLISRRVTMESEDALTRSDKKHGIILACQAHAAKTYRSTREIEVSSRMPCAGSDRSFLERFAWTTWLRTEENLRCAEGGAVALPVRKDLSIAGR